MTYNSKPNQLKYDDWFDKNIESCDLEYEKEKKFINSVHDKFIKMSNHNLIIARSEASEDLEKEYKCSDVFCSITDKEFKRL